MQPFTLRSALRYLTLASTVIVGLLMVLQGWTMVSRQRQIQVEAFQLGSSEAQRAAHSIDGILKGLVPVARNIAKDLNSGNLAPDSLPQRLHTDLEKVPAAFRLGVTFAPYAKDPKVKLFAPYVVREPSGLRNYEMEQSVDYSVSDWYQEDLQKEGWGEPHLSKSTNQVVAGFHVPFRLPGSTRPGPDGQVRIDLSLGDIRKIITNLSLGRTGYGFLNSPKGTYLAHPSEDLVAQRKNLVDEAEGLDAPDRQRLAELARTGARGHVEAVSKLAKLPVMVFIEPIPTSHWSLGAALFKSELGTNTTHVRRSFIDLACLVIAFFLLGGLLYFNVLDGVSAKWWKYKILASLLFTGGITLLWSLTLVLPDPPADRAVPMVDQEGVDDFLHAKGIVTSSFKQVAIERVPTGLHLETLRFGGSNDVVVTGHVWQKYELARQTNLGRGFTFPDAESSDIKEVFRRQIGGLEIVEYAFRATLRQRFETNHKYPFDQAVIRIRLWPKDFDTSLLLVPDLEAYQILNPSTLPGVDKGLVIPGWKKVSSYFGFILRGYSTNFGISCYAGQEEFPELSFQFILARKFLDPFISTLLPVIVVACLLYTLLMAGTKIKEKVAATGFKATDILRAAATLLFPVVYAQINLRGRLAASGLLYLEYFYFVMYAVILLVAVNALAFSLGENGILHRGDNALPKLLYWPVVLGTFFAISLAFLY